MRGGVRLGPQMHGVTSMPWGIQPALLEASRRREREAMAWGTRYGMGYPKRPSVDSYFLMYKEGGHQW